MVTVVVSPLTRNQRNKHGCVCLWEDRVELLRYYSVSDVWSVYRSPVERIWEHGRGCDSSRSRVLVVVGMVMVVVHE